MTAAALYESKLKLPLSFRGKVRDIYDLKDRLLIVVTDRLSAFDHILPTPIPGKGIVLNQMTHFWMEKFLPLLPNHLLATPLEDVISDPEELKVLQGRCEIVRKAQPLPVELIVRGYLSGSGYQEYQEKGSICGLKLPPGLREADRLPEPILTPSTKAERGQHDENIPFSQMVEWVGEKIAVQAKEICLNMYRQAAEYALSRGIIIADTKFELGLIDGELTLIDEVLTPDSSRFWPVDAYQPGKNPPSFDKQFVRDYLNSLGWNHQAPAPALPEAIASKTAEKYQEGWQRLRA